MKPTKEDKDHLGEMSLDNFFDTMDHDEFDNETMENPTGKVATKKSKKKTKPAVKKQKLKVKTKKASQPSRSESDSNDEEAEQEQSYKSALTKLEKTDPELFKYLEQNDKKLLKFGGGVELEDSESEDEDSSKVHKPFNELEVASDESDYENEEKPLSKDGNTITLKMLKLWQENLGSEDVSIDTIRSAIKAFNSALISISGEDGEQGSYKVEGAAIFNGIIQLCVLNLEKAIRTFLKLGSKSNFKEIQKCKRFTKVKSVLRAYLLDLTKLLESVTSKNILSVVLKHLHQLASVLAAFSSITKPILKRLIFIWSSSEESIRILSFLCILKITRSQPEYTLNQVLKIMYMEYVKNSKFVSKNTVPAINFMRRSLTEMFVLDLNVAYQHIFLFVRQLAIHLRNAILLQKKEHFQQIYSWQYVNSLKLWGDVLSNISVSSSQNGVKAESRSKLVSLIYPFVSIVTGVIKLKSSANYFPLRFQCVKILIDLSRATNVYIPTLPFILEVLNSNSFKQQHKKLSMKPISFACSLRIQKGQLDENAFRDETIEQVFGLTIECLLNDCTSISFPDLVVPHVMALNLFIKSTKNPNYAKKLKQLHDKIIEQANYVDVRRNKINFSLNDMNYIKSWETNLRTGTSPLEVFHASWDKSNKQKIKRQITDTEDGEHDYGNLPKIVGPTNKKIKTDGEPVVLFPSDDESESSENFEACSDDFESDNSEEDNKSPPAKKQANPQNNMKSKKPVVKYDSEEENKTYFDDGDIVEDLAIENW